MSLRFRFFAAPLALAALGALLVASDDAEACGGCFHQPSPDPSQTSVVTAHRMAFSISTAQTVLWDQVQYAGAPKDFAWVLPVKPGARLEASNAAWFEALDTATSERVFAPQLNCGAIGIPFGDDVSSSPGCSLGCGAAAVADAYAPGEAAAAGGTGGAAAPPPAVTVVHEGTVGPYETVTIHANVKDALPSWLTSHGYAIDASVKPVIDAYTNEGFDFIALRLQPDASVRQMTPVRVISPGAEPTLPLRMVAAGTGANVDITLFVIGEGRWEAKNFANDQVAPATLTWDFNASSSDYATQRLQALAKNDGRTWSTAYARRGALLTSALTAPLGSDASSFLTAPDGSPATAIADLYVATGVAEGAATTSRECGGQIDSYGTNASLVVDVCTTTSGAGGAGGGMAGSASGGVGGSPSGGGGGSGGSGGGAMGGGGAGGKGGSGTTSSSSSSSSTTGSTSSGGTEVCGAAGGGQIDARELTCGPLDDVATALVGMHPADVWVTRLEARLPRAALADDLVIRASPAQTLVDSWVYAGQAKNQPTGCTVAPSATSAGGAAINPFSRRRAPGSRRRNDAAALFTALAALAFAALRRMRRAPAPGSVAAYAP